MTAIAPDIQKNISASQAAAALGVSAVTVRSWCHAGMVGQYVAIPGTKCGYYLLSEAEIEWLKIPTNRPKIGRPRKNSADSVQN